MRVFTGNMVGLSKEEKALPYAKYYEWEMAQVPEEKLKAAEAPSETKAVAFEERNRFLSGDDGDYCQIGYGIAENGTGFVCNTTYMPGVRGEMLDWWFPWHSIGSDLRYKIWDREDHYFARADRADYVCDPNVPVREKTWGVNHYIIEDTGMGPQFLELCFKSPEDYGYDASLIGTAKCESLVCAIGEGECAAAMTHKWYPHEDGVMFCSRFWVGYGETENGMESILPENASVPEQVVQGLFIHNIKEFSNLAAILPEVYRENKDNF